MEKSNKNRVCALRFKISKKYELIDWNEFFCSFLHTKPSNNLLQPIILCVEMPGHYAGGNPSQRRSLKMKSMGIIIGTCKASAFWRRSPQCQKFDGICSLIPSLNVQLLCFHFFWGDAVFFPTGSCGPCAVVGNVDLHISHPRHLHLSTNPWQGHCPSLAFLPVSSARLGL